MILILNSANLYGGMCGGARACVRVRAHACVCDVLAIYDDNVDAG